MINENGNLTADAEKYLSPEEIDLFNRLPRDSASFIIARQSVAAQLISAGIQRKALFDIEERGKTMTKRANLIAALAATAVFLQVIVEVARWLSGINF